MKSAVSRVKKHDFLAINGFFTYKMALAAFDAASVIIIKKIRPGLNKII
jgi:hypothetical protein